MRPQWDNQLIQLNTAIDQIRSVLPALPSTFTTAQGLVAPTDSVLLTLEELYATMQMVNNSTDVDPVLLGIHQNGVLSPIPNIATYAANLLSSPTQALIDQIAQQTWGIRASLVWLVPRKASTEHFENSVHKFVLDSKLELLESLTERFRAYMVELKSGVESASSSLEIVLDSTERIKGFEREASTARTNTEASAAVATTSKDIVTSQLQVLNEGVTQQHLLLSEIRKLKEMATSTLESTSKVALAASFSERKKILGDEQRFWRIAFGAGIATLLLVGFTFALGWLVLPPIIIDSKIELGPILTRIALIGPIVWFTWFAVRSLSTTNRLIEDYAFKEASALAFVGYQREMKDDAEMIKLLRESAIHNFGNQPTRIFEKNDPASPLHDLFARALDTGGIDKAVELIKALRSGK